MPVTEASIPRLPGIPSPDVNGLMRSGWLLYENGQELIAGVQAAFAGKDANAPPLGQGDLLPMSKGFLFVPRLNAFSLAREGDLYAMGKLIAAYTTEFILPIPDSIGTALKVGELVTDLLDIDLVIPDMAEYELQKTLRHILTDKRTVAIPYVDIVDWRIADFRGKRRAMALSTEDAAGAKRDFFFVFEGELGHLDDVLESRWKQEFQELVVQIVESAIDIDEFWRDFKNDPTLGQGPDAALHHSQLHIEDMPLRFYLGGTDVSAYLIAQGLEWRLEEAGYKQAEALAGVYLYEDIGRRLMTIGPEPWHIAWILAMTDPRLAGELMERMAPNIDVWREVLRDNGHIKLNYKYSYVEMLEKCARGEGLGRVQVSLQGPYY